MRWHHGIVCPRHEATIFGAETDLIGYITTNWHNMPIVSLSSIDVYGLSSLEELSILIMREWRTNIKIN